MEKKEDIRKRILKSRKEQAAADWESGTARITETVVSCRWFLEAEVIYCYLDFNGEVGTRRLIERAWQLGKAVLVPRVSGDTMQFCEINSFDSLEKGAFGIPEPQGVSAWEEKPGADDAKGLVIVPGVAFDRKGNRVGYGKGYYDRYLAAHPGLHTIAIAFELQIVEDVEAEAQDIRLEMLVTEKKGFIGIQAV